MANRLIALDKCLGVHLIGIGKALQRILGKTAALVTRSDLEEVRGVDRLCPCFQSGTIHAVCELFNVHCNFV